jgi:hypothetical protein
MLKILLQTTTKIQDKGKGTIQKKHLKQILKQ